MICASFGAWAQKEAEFTADRPGGSTDPSVVGYKVIQLEQGIQYDADGGAGTFIFSNTLLRYGLFPNMELRLGGDGFIYQNTNGGVEQCFPAFSGLSVGTKIKCFDGVGAIPAVSVLADYLIPNTATKGYEVVHLAPSPYLLFENPVMTGSASDIMWAPNGMVLCLHRQYLLLSAWVSVRQIVWVVLWRVTTTSTNSVMCMRWTSASIGR